MRWRYLHSRRRAPVADVGAVLVPLAPAESSKHMCVLALALACDPIAFVWQNKAARVFMFCSFSLALAGGFPDCLQGAIKLRGGQKCQYVVHILPANTTSVNFHFVSFCLLAS